MAEEGGKVLGYATSGPFRPKQAYETSVETSVYVAPEQVGRGVGGLLYASLFQVLEREDVRQALGGVAPPNEARSRSAGAPSHTGQRRPELERPKNSTSATATCFLSEVA